MTIRFGILGTSNISQKNIRAMVVSKSCRVVAIASRSVERANTFLTNLNLSSSVTVMPNYESLIASKDVDAIYIPLPTTLHLEWTIKAAANGKHILLEKPAAINLSELQDILKACKENKVFFMDGVMFMHHLRMKSLYSVLQDPFTPAATHVNSSFSFNADEAWFQSNIRAKSDADCLGCLGDLGWYCVRIGVLAFNKTFDSISDRSKIIMPTKCVCHCTKWSGDGLVPFDVTGKVYFDSDGCHRELSFDCSFLKAFRQRFEIICMNRESYLSDVGDKIITCDDFVIPYYPNSATLQIETFHSKGFPLYNYATAVMSNKEVVTISVPSTHLQQEVLMFDNFSNLIKETSGGRISHDLNAPWMNITLLTQTIVDSCYKSMKCNGAETLIDCDCFV